jgi:uncharacterized membrane protein
MEERGQEDDTGLERLVFFSDAVFAIAITLLALDIRLPELPEGVSVGEMLRRLLGLWPNYLGYVLSFTVIGLFWLGHHRMFRFIRRYDARLLLLALLQLMFVAFLPFPTSLIGAHPASAVVAILYALMLSGLGAVSALIWRYASHNGRLLAEGVNLDEANRNAARLLIMPGLFAISGVAALLSVVLTWAIWVALLVISIGDVLVSWDRPARISTFGSSLAKRGGQHGGNKGG